MEHFSTLEELADSSQGYCGKGINIPVTFTKHQIKLGEYIIPPANPEDLGPFLEAVASFAHSDPDGWLVLYRYVTCPYTFVYAVKRIVDSKLDKGYSINKLIAVVLEGNLK